MGLANILMVKEISEAVQVQQSPAFALPTSWDDDVNGLEILHAYCTGNMGNYVMWTHWIIAI